QAAYYRREYGMEIAIVRPFNVYGGVRYAWKGERSHVIPMLVHKVLSGEYPVRVWGDGSQKRNFMHVRDVAWLMTEMTERYPLEDPVNLGDERELSIRELIEAILRLTGRSSRLLFDHARPAGKARKCADSRTLRSLFPDFRARADLDTGILEIIEAVRSRLQQPLDRSL